MINDVRPVIEEYGLGQVAQVNEHMHSGTDRFSIVLTPGEVAAYSQCELNRSR
jgi:hypothetical protein